MWTISVFKSNECLETQKNSLKTLQSQRVAQKQLLSIHRTRFETWLDYQNVSNKCTPNQHTYSNDFQRNFAFGFRRSSPKMCDECCSKIKHVFRMLMTGHVLYVVLRKGLCLHRWFEWASVLPFFYETLCSNLSNTLFWELRSRK